MDHAAKGAKALAASRYEDAITAYTAAIKVSPTSPDYHAKRSQAYQRAGKHTEALEDAEKAVVFAQKRAKRELIIDAQYKRAVALYQLGRYGDAGFVIEVVKRMDSKHKQADMIKARVQMAADKLENGDEKMLVRVKEAPEVDLESSKAESEPSSHKAGTSSGTTEATAPEQPPAPQPAQQQTRADKIRHEWYQNTDNVYFTLLAKGVPKDKSQIDITANSLSISFPLDTGSSFDFTVEPLFAPVVPEKCVPRVLGTKVEVVLAKATPGQKWSALEGDHSTPKAPPAATADRITDNDAVKQAVLNSPNGSSKPSGPAYPTSSKSGPKNWDKIEVDDDKGGDEANDFFKMLYKSASPETQRAMIKSYTESNGTALSTNWSEVGKAKVETTPPDGMEAKTWGK